MAMQNLQNGRSMTEVLQDIVGNIQEIFRSEFRLAKVEIHEETAKALRSAVPLGIGALLALYGYGRPSGGMVTCARKLTMPTMGERGALLKSRKMTWMRPAAASKSRNDTLPWR